MCFKVNSKLNNIHRFFTESLRWGPYGSHNPNSRTSITGMSQLLHCKHCVHHRSEITYTQIAWSLSVCPSVRPSVRPSVCHVVWMFVLSFCQSCWLSVLRPSVYLSVLHCPSVRPSVMLSGCLSYLSVSHVVCPSFVRPYICLSCIVRPSSRPSVSLQHQRLPCTVIRSCCWEYFADRKSNILYFTCDSLVPMRVACIYMYYT